MRSAGYVEQCLSLAAESHAPPADEKESWRAARLHRNDPPGFQDAIAMGSHTFPSYGILWARLRGVLAAGRPDGESTTTFG